MAANDIDYILPRNRVFELSFDAYEFVFQMLDVEPGLGGYEASRVASAVKRAFENACLEDMSENDPLLQFFTDDATGPTD